MAVRRIHPPQRCTMRLLCSQQASLSTQTPRTEKTVDTHKNTVPITSRCSPSQFWGVMLNIVEPLVAPPNLVLVAVPVAATAGRASKTLTHKLDNNLTDTHDNEAIRRLFRFPTVAQHLFCQATNLPHSNLRRHCIGHYCHN